VARLADAPVLLWGTSTAAASRRARRHAGLLEPDDRARVAGLIINRLRGDASVLAPAWTSCVRAPACRCSGVPWITER